MLLRNGKCINFWEDPSCGLVPLKEKFGDLFEICVQQNKSVAEMASGGWNLNFRRWLDERAQNQLRQLRDMLTCSSLSNEKDTVKWMWEKTGIFSVKSMYSHLFCRDLHNPNYKLWKSKTPLKVKSFMWLLQ
jgi:hypothetical protein